MPNSIRDLVEATIISDLYKQVTKKSKGRPQPKRRSNRGDVSRAVESARVERRLPLNLTKSGRENVKAYRTFKRRTGREPVDFPKSES